MKRKSSVRPKQSNMNKTDSPLIVKRKFSLREIRSFLNQRLVYIILVISILAIAMFTTHPEWFQKYNTKAATNTAQITLQPAQVNAIPTTTVQLWTTTSASTGFVNVEIDFNPSRIRLTNDATLTSTTLTRLVRRTSFAEANTTGKLFLTLGLDPSKRSNPPQGTMQLGTLNFTAVTPAVIALTPVTVSQTTSSVVGMDAALMSVTSSGTIVYLTIFGDITGEEGVPDNVVDLFDYSAVVEHYGNTGNALPEDITGEEGVPDGIVDLFDLSVTIEHYGERG
jgi:hypothetical protein